MGLKSWVRDLYSNYLRKNMNFIRNIIPLLERNQLAISVLLSTGAYITKNHYQLKKDDLLDQRAKLHDKIMHLYAPMVGNRLVHSMAVKSFEDKHKMPIEDVMKIICERR